MHQKIIDYMAVCESTTNYDRFEYSILKKEIVKRYGRVNVPKIAQKSRAEAFQALLILAGVFASPNQNKLIRNASLAVHYWDKDRARILNEINEIQKLISRIAA